MSVDALIVERWGVDIIIVVDVGQGGGGMARLVGAVSVVVAALVLALGLGSGDPPPPVAVRKEGTGLVRKELFIISPCPADAATTAEEEAEP